MRQPDRPFAHQHLFVRTVDAAPVRFVRPSDTDRETWVAYDGPHYLGTVHGQFDTDGHWHIQSLHEDYLKLDDAVRAMRRPDTWRADRERVRRWARDILNDRRLLVVDVQTTGLTAARAVQIGVTDRDGNALFNELVNPLCDITAAAVTRHGLSPNRLATAPTFGAIMPDLARLLAGRLCLAYNARFDRGVLERETHRLPKNVRGTWGTRTPACWKDAMAPYAAWKGLWSTRHGTYRYQPLGSAYDAITNCRRLLATMHRMCTG
ncbi:3'-5' exonuclease [Streptomyces sp. NPDC002343]